MKSLTINFFAAGTSLLLLSGCADLNPALVEVNAVCRDGWYGYWQRPCEPPAPPYGVADAQREIADLKAEVQSLKDQLATANQLIARISENQARLQNQMNLAKVEKDLLLALQPEIARGTVSVVPSNEGLTISLNSTLLFAPGQDRLQASGENTLKRVGSVLKDFPERHVRVIGHTDAAPIRGALQKKFPSNKELSDARARNAAEALQKGGFNGAVSAEGRGDGNPVATNDTPEGRAKNRRIEVVVSS